ncbi:MAG: class I SAM-dependent methyltransferase [Puia sp.]|nr:class I SAM-dependent methyltransferase [Puia sp.]
MQDPRENASQFVDRYLKKHLDEVVHGAVLEAGCGSGAILHAIAREYSNLFIIGVDRSEDMAGKARSEVAGLNHVWATSADIYELPFPDDNFDLVYSRFLYEELEDPVRATKELFRVCKPGGKLVLQDLDGRKLFSFGKSTCFSFLEAESECWQKLSALFTLCFVKG